MKYFAMCSICRVLEKVIFRVKHARRRLFKARRLRVIRLCDATRLRAVARFQSVSIRRDGFGHSDLNLIQFLVKNSRSFHLREILNSYQRVAKGR